MGTLYYGDNLDILRRHLKDESVDLGYLDPPFNSAQNYNAFFHENGGTDAASQIRAFEDTWHWDIETKKAYDAVTEQPGKVSATRRKSPWRCWSGSSKRAAIPATWCWTRSAAAARRLTPPRGSAAIGSALT